MGNLGKEYEDFFNGETDRNYGGKPNITLDGLQAGFFMGYAAWGWVLAALIAAALTSAIGGK